MPYIYIMDKLFVIIAIAFSLVGCGDTSEKVQHKPEKEKTNNPLHLVNDYPTFADKQGVMVVIEIPAGTSEKWEVNKESGQLERDSIDNEPRSIKYLGYPTNYGFIPQTILPKSEGGDGDPLDAIVLGEPIQQGDLISCKPIGILKLLDRNEGDDKLIMVSINSPFSEIDNLEELHDQFPGITEIIETWFVNYKGPDKMKSLGFGDQNEAMQMIVKAHREFLKLAK